MTYFISTRNKNIRCNSIEAIIQGLAQDGGLFIPEKIDSIDNIYKLKDLVYPDLASKIISFIFDDIDPLIINKICHKAYSDNFDTPQITPLKKINNHYFLELYHGPTSAFKDIALQFLPLLITNINKDDKDIVILSATSGDTGKAALEGFKDVDKTHIKVLYPYKMISKVQEKQMVTTKGDNTEVIAVNGNFDDCQRMVKKILEDNHINNIHLTSANSINIARLIPQVVYYFKAYFDLLNNSEINKDEKIDFIVPTGNFGDILAGYFAKKMGLPIDKLVLASNSNDVIKDFINTGIYDANRILINTSSPSIDILISSNLERLLFLKSNDDKLVKDLMNSLKENRKYEIPNYLKESIQEDFIAFKTSEEESKETIKEYFNKYHYLIDTHTAIAASLIKKYQSKNKIIVLSTASPYKFSKHVYEAITNETIKDDLDAMDKLFSLTNIEIPKNLKELNQLEDRFKEVINKDDEDIITRKLSEL